MRAVSDAACMRRHGTPPRSPATPVEESGLDSRDVMADRILVLEQAPGLGGSTVALGRLLRRLDRSRFEPVVAVQHDVQRQHLRAIGLTDIEILDAPLVGSFPTTNPARRGIARRILGVVPGLVRLAKRHGPAAELARRIIRERNIRLVHLNNALSANLGGFWAAWRTGVPCVVKQRGYEWDSPDVRWAARRVAAFLADSEDVARDLARLEIPPERIVVNYAPIDLEPFDAPVDRDAVRAELGIPRGALAFGILGCLQPWKGQSVFLDAAARVLPHSLSAHAVVVGGGDEHFMPGFGAKLRAKAASLGIAARTTFTGHRSDVARVLAALDVCVHASTDAEPFGMVVSEAMAARLPVIASSAGGPAEQVDEGRSGFLVPPRDAAGIADRLLRLLGDPAMRCSMGEAGRAIVAARFSSERHAEMTVAVYDRAIAGR